MNDRNDKKRQLSSTSTVSDLDLSLNTSLDRSVVDKPPAKDKSKNKSSKKAKIDSKDSKMSDSLQQKIEEINKKLSNMLTKNDKDFIKGILIDTLEDMKDKIIGHVIHRVEILESEIFDKANEQIVLKKEIQDCKIKNNELKEENKNIKIEIDKEIATRKDHINNLEQYGRRNNIRVSGLDFDNKFESARETTEGIVSIINEKMKLDLSCYDIDIAHRLGKFEEKKIRPVIVKFVSRHTKYNVMHNTKKLKGTTLSFNEDLTKLNQQVLSSMRLKDKSTVVKAWSYDRKLYAKYKDETQEVITFSKFQTWLDMPWPKNKV